MIDQTPAAEGWRIRLVLARSPQSVRLCLPRLVPAGPAPGCASTATIRSSMSRPASGSRTLACVCPDESLVRRYIANGKPSIATFADMFRYKMIQMTGCCWVDADIICLTNPSFAAEAYVFCRQADAVSTLLVNNAVLRLPPSEPALAELVATAESAVDVDQKWGALGPFLLTPVLTKHGLYEQGARSACLLSDRTRAVLEAVPAELSGSRRRKGQRAQACCTFGARRSAGAVTTSASVRPRAPISTNAFERSALSTVSAASAMKTKCAASWPGRSRRARAKRDRAR